MIGGAYYGGPRIQTYGLDADPNAWMGLGADMGVGVYEHSVYYPAYGGYGKLSFGTYNGTTYSTKMILLESGNCGIGTTGPQSPLHIKASTGYGSIRISPSSDNAEASMGFFNDNAGTMGSTAWVIGQGCWGNTGKFIIGNQVSSGPVIVVQQDGKVGIGTSNPQNLLDVNGTVHAREFKASLDGWSDYVFAGDYRLMSLKDVENYIKTNNKLPEVPSAGEVKKEGVNLGKMNALLLKKVEELTLYIIELNKKIGKLESERNK